MADQRISNEDSAKQHDARRAPGLLVLVLGFWLFAIAAAVMLAAPANAQAVPSMCATGDWRAPAAALIVKIKKHKHDDDDDTNSNNSNNDDHKSDNGDHHHNKKDKDKDKNNAKERSCPVGYVVLDKPNKYGAYCEPKEGLPPPKPPEPETCKFPGQVGTPPNCTCPENTEFLGYKGCVKYKREQYCNDLDSTGLEAFATKCKGSYYGLPSCHTFSTEWPGDYRCCCYYRIYEK